MLRHCDCISRPTNILPASLAWQTIEEHPVHLCFVHNSQTSTFFNLMHALRARTSWPEPRKRIVACRHKSYSAERVNTLGSEGASKAWGQGRIELTFFYLAMFALSVLLSFVFTRYCAQPGIASRMGLSSRVFPPFAQHALAPAWRDCDFLFFSGQHRLHNSD